MSNSNKLTNRNFNYNIDIKIIRKDSITKKYQKQLKTVELFPGDFFK